MKVQSQQIGSGKLGASVYSMYPGACVTRIYSPHQTNPNSPKQVSTRARLKLLSQLAAALVPVLAFPKVGMVSARNQFVKRNFDITYSNDGAAAVSFENLQLTIGTRGLPAIIASRSAANQPISVRLSVSADMAYSRVCYIMYSKSDEQKLQYVASLIASDTAGNGFFEAELPACASDAIIWAYGIRDANTTATAQYGRYGVESGEDLAKLIMSRKMRSTNYQLSQTRGLQLLAGQLATEVINEESSQLFLTESGPGSVTGAGIYPNGYEVVAQATPDEGATFVAWRDNRTQRVISYCPTLKFNIEQQEDIVAVFDNPNSAAGGFNGGSGRSPLPYENTQVEILGDLVDITSGYVVIDEQYDNITISNIVEGHTLVYVPAGSYLGASDNLTFTYRPAPRSDYNLAHSGLGLGAIYLDSMLFFYLGDYLWTNPYPDALVSIDGSQPQKIYSSYIYTPTDDIGTIDIYNVPSDANIRLGTGSGPVWNFQWQEDKQRWHIAIGLTDYGEIFTFIFTTTWFQFKHH